MNQERKGKERKGKERKGKQGEEENLEGMAVCLNQAV